MAHYAFLTYVINALTAEGKEEKRYRTILLNDIPKQYRWVHKEVKGWDATHFQFFSKVLGNCKIHCMGDGCLALETTIERDYITKPIQFFCKFHSRPSSKPSADNRVYWMELWYQMDEKRGKSHKSFKCDSKERLKQIFTNTLNFFTYYKDYQDPKKVMNWALLMDKLDYALSKIE